MAGRKFSREEMTRNYERLTFDNLPDFLEYAQSGHSGDTVSKKQFNELKKEVDDLKQRVTDNRSLVGGGGTSFNTGDED